MLMITNDQMEVLRQYMVKKFENLIVAHLNVYFPEASQALGEEGVRKEIRYGIDQTKRRGIMIERDISKYINLMFMFGRDFDTDPALPWAGDILANENIGGLSEKMDALYEEAKNHINDVVSVNSQNRRNY